MVYLASLLLTLYAKIETERLVYIRTNPKWDEITRELCAGQVSFDRHDLIARVFHLKLKLMMDLLTKESTFGTALCYMYNVEWQKRGLPHAHILLWLLEKVRPNDIDKLISAEFRNADELFHRSRTPVVELQSPATL